MGAGRMKKAVMEEARISVHAQPNAGKDEVVGWRDGVLWLRVAAPPLKGEANAALVAFLARRLGVSRREVFIVSGAASRNKVVAIAGLEQEQVFARLHNLEEGLC